MGVGGVSSVSSVGDVCGVCGAGVTENGGSWKICLDQGTCLSLNCDVSDIKTKLFFSKVNKSFIFQ